MIGKKSAITIPRLQYYKTGDKSWGNSQDIYANINVILPNLTQVKLAIIQGCNLTLNKVLVSLGLAELTRCLKIISAPGLFKEMI
jgi:hypothetical protein